MYLIKKNNICNVNGYVNIWSNNLYVQKWKVKKRMVQRNSGEKKWQIQKNTKKERKKVWQKGKENRVRKSVVNTK